MTRYTLGVDVGATKTHALIADELGQAIGFGEGGAGNPQNVGYPGLTAALITAVDQALQSAGISRERIAGAGFGIAGYDWPSQREVTLRALQPLELSAALEIVNDTIVGLLAGAAEGWGVALVAGTGCNCRGRDRNRREGRVTGFGSQFGEAAGATELVASAIRGVAYEWSRRGPATRLSQAFIELAGARDLGDLVEGLSVGRYHIDASAAPTVLQLAGEGDAVALDTVRWAGRELGAMAVGVIHQLNFESLDFEVVLVGSLYHCGPLLLDPLRETVHAVAPRARFVRLDVPPVVGAVLLGMEQAAVNTAGLRSPLINSTQRLLHDSSIARSVPMER